MTSLTNKKITITSVLLTALVASLIVFLPFPSEAQSVDGQSDNVPKKYRVEVLSKEVIDTTFVGETKIVTYKQTVKLIDKPTIGDLIADNKDHLAFLESQGDEKGKKLVAKEIKKLQDIADSIQDVMEIETIKVGDHSITFGTTTRDGPNGNVKDPVNMLHYDRGFANNVENIIDTYASHGWKDASGGTQYVYIDNTAHGGIAYWQTTSYQLEEGDYFGTRFHVRIFSGSHDGHGQFGDWSLGAVHKEEWNGFGHTILSWESAETELKSDLTGKTGVGSIGSLSMGNEGLYQGQYNDGTGRQIQFT